MAAPDFENYEWIYTAHPIGFPTVDGNFKLQPCAPPASPDAGQIVLELKVVSVDPYLRGRMAASHAYLGAWTIGKPPTSIAISQIVDSRSDKFAAGDHVLYFECPWQKRFTISDSATNLLKISSTEFPLRYYASALGMTGLTAFFSEKYLAVPKPGDVAFVSGAAGAVGSVVGQLLKAHGCRVLGSAGSDAKVSFLRDIGFDDAFNYKTTTTAAALSAFAPDGIDIYYDNVGGETLDAALAHMRTFGRVVLCGAISQYNAAGAEDVYGVKNLRMAVVKQLRLEGFLVRRWAAEFDDGRAAMAQLLRDGRVTVRDTVVNGFENVPAAFIAMLRGENTGKMIIDM